MNAIRALGPVFLSLLVPLRTPAAETLHLVIADAVNVRARPDASSSVIGVLPILAPVHVDQVTGDGWASVRFHAGGVLHRGHVRAEFLEPHATDYVRAVAEAEKRIQSRATDPSAPLEARLPWLQRWAAMDPHGEAALAALRDAYASLGNTRDAEAIERRLRDGVPVHLGVCIPRSPRGEGHARDPCFDDRTDPCFAGQTAERHGNYVLVASVTSEKIVARLDPVWLFDRGAGGAKPTAELDWGKLPWRHVPRGERTNFPTPRRIPGASIAGDLDPYSDTAMAGRVELASTPCDEGSMVATALLPEARRVPADWQNAARWRKSMAADPEGEARPSQTMSAETVVLGGLRITSVRIGPLWAAFDEQATPLVKQGAWFDATGNSRADFGTIRWLVLPDGKRLLAVTRYRMCNVTPGVLGCRDGIGLFVVGQDRRVQSVLIDVSGWAESA